MGATQFITGHFLFFSACSRTPSNPPRTPSGPRTAEYRSKTPALVPSEIICPRRIPIPRFYPVTRTPNAVWSLSSARSWWIHATRSLTAKPGFTRSNEPLLFRSSLTADAKTNDQWTGEHKANNWGCVINVVGLIYSYDLWTSLDPLSKYDVAIGKTRLSAVTGDFQTAPQVVLVLSVLFGHSYLTHIAYYYVCIFVDLVITDII